MGLRRRNGILGVVVGDALGCPVQFELRKDVAKHPVKGMRGHGTFNLPTGTWTDDSSLTLALLDSINANNGIDLRYIMKNFVSWLENGKYTPYGYSFDIGRGTILAISAYERYNNPYECGGKGESNNGDGSLMRIMPCCLYCYEKGLDDKTAIKTVHDVGSLTHGHIRANIACGLYYFMVKAVLNEEGTLNERLQKGLDEGFAFYEGRVDEKELAFYNRVRNIEEFAKVDRDEINSSGYVVDAFEASVWSLITTNSFKEALLKAVNLGLDTDTIGAITGGLGALYYGIGGDNGIPEGWIDVLQRCHYIESMCLEADKRLNQHMFSPS